MEFSKLSFGLVVYCFSIVHFQGVFGRENELTYLGTIEKDFNEKNYYASNIVGIWTAGLQDCKDSFGPQAHLLSLESGDESRFISNWLENRGAPVGLFWTSGIYEAVSQGWIWAGNPNSTFLDFTNWGPNEPAAENTKQRIGFYHNNGVSSYWKAEDDTASYRYICEVPVDPTLTTEPPLTTEYVSTAAPIPTTTEGSGDQPTPCSESINLLVLAESTKSTGILHYNTVKSFVAKLSMAFTPESSTKFGFMTFADIVDTVVSQSNNMDPDEIRNEILVAKYLNLPTRYTHQGMVIAKVHLESHSGHPKIMIVITNGLSALPDQTKIAGKLCEDYGITVYAIGVEGSDNEELSNIVAGHQERIYKTTYNSLNTILLSLSEAVCSESA